MAVRHHPGRRNEIGRHVTFLHALQERMANNFFGTQMKVIECLLLPPV
jgi:hypothetical protein